MTNGSIVLARHGTCLAEIALPEEPNKIELFAHGELTRYLERMTSATPCPCDAGPLPRPRIHLVRKESDKPLWYPATDAFTIGVKDGEIHIEGTSRALLYGVYHLLESLGARFFIADDEDEALPFKEQLSIPCGYMAREEAEFPFRAVDPEWLVKRDWPLARCHIGWMAKKRFNILQTHPGSYSYDMLNADIIRFKELEELIVPELEKRGIALNVGIHTTWHFLPPSIYLPEHKDWYAFKTFSTENQPKDEGDLSCCAAQTRKPRDSGEGHLDFFIANLRKYFSEPVDVQPLMGTIGGNNIAPLDRLQGLSIDGTMSIPTQIHYTNTGAIRTYADNLLAYLRSHPYVGIIGVWPADINNYCACGKCAANPSAIVEASIYVARRVGEEFPHVLVEHLLYTGATANMPPDDVALPANLLVVSSTVDRARPWAARCAKDGTPGVYLLNYTLADNFFAQGHVCINPRHAIKDMAAMRANGLSGFTVFYIDMLSYWRSCQNIALLGAMAWRWDLSVDDHLADFCDKYYRSAGVAMRLVYQKLFGLDEARVFTDAAASDSARILETLSQCRQSIKDALSGMNHEDRDVLPRRLAKLSLYIEHLALHAEATRCRCRSLALMNENDIRGAATALHQAALRLEEIKAMCLDSFLNGDGVLDWRLTLTLRKLVGYPDNLKLIDRMLKSVDKQGMHAGERKHQW